MDNSLWTPQRRKNVEEASSFRELRAIAFEILIQMREELQPRQSISKVCGPISPYRNHPREENLAALTQAIKRLTKDGWVIFNQLPFEAAIVRISQQPGITAVQLLDEFYGQIIESGLIHHLFFLPNWEHSIGAMEEHERAKKRKIPVIYLAQCYSRLD